MSADYTITCSDCGTLLPDARPDEAAEERQPCPKCGSTNRNVSVTVHPATIQLKASTNISVRGVVEPAEEADVAQKIEAVMNEPPVREVVSTRDVTLRIIPPKSDNPGWVVQAWDGDNLIAMAPADQFDDAYLAVGDEIGDAMKEADED